MDISYLHRCGVHLMMQEGADENIVLLSLGME